MNDFKQLFPLGEKNDAYAQYFKGQSYLAVLTQEGVFSANVTFEPGCRNNCISIIKEGKYFIARLVTASIRRKESLHNHCTRVKW